MRRGANPCVDGEQECSRFSVIVPHRLLRVGVAIRGPKPLRLQAPGHRAGLEGDHFTDNGLSCQAVDPMNCCPCAAIPSAVVLLCRILPGDHPGHRWQPELPGHRRCGSWRARKQGVGWCGVLVGKGFPLRMLGRRLTATQPQEKVRPNVSSLQPAYERRAISGHP